MRDSTSSERAIRRERSLRALSLVTRWLRACARTARSMGCVARSMSRVARSVPRVARVVHAHDDFDATDGLRGARA
jgi:hypothetical protein